MSFDNVTIRDRRDRPWAAYVGAGGIGAAHVRGAADIMGDVTVYNPHGCWCELGNTTGPGGVELIDVAVDCHHGSGL